MESKISIFFIFGPMMLIGLKNHVDWSEFFFWWGSRDMAKKKVEKTQKVRQKRKRGNDLYFLFRLEILKEEGLNRMRN